MNARPPSAPTAGGSPEPRPATVIEALTRVIRDLPAIARDRRAPDDHGGYAYRGIDQITAHVAPLLALHGIVIVPRVDGCEIRDVVLHEQRWTDTVLTVRYRMYGPGGHDDYLEATVIGIGRDNADKGANKALTQAYKYLLVQTLCIADAKHDADGDTFVAEALPQASRHAIDELTERIRAAPPAVGTPFKRWKAEQRFAWPWSDAAVAAMHEKLDEVGVPAVAHPTQPIRRVVAGDDRITAVDKTAH